MAYRQTFLKTGTQILFIIASLLSFGIVVYAMILPHENVKFDNEQAILFTQGWKYQSADGKVRDVMFPSSLPENIPGGIRITNTLPDHAKIFINSIGKFSVFQQITLYIDGNLIYKSADPRVPRLSFDKTGGSYWIIQRLPADFAGKTITMDITSAYPNYRQVSGNVFLGTKASILFAVVHECLSNYFIAILMMVLGTLFCIFYFFGSYRYKFSIRCFYIGALQFWIGAWEFSESGLLQLVSGNVIYGTALSFVAMRMSVIALLVYFGSVTNDHWRRWNGILLVILGVEAIVSSVLQLTHILDFYETVGYYHILLILAMVTVVIETLLEVFHYRNRSLYYLFLGMLLVAGAAIYEVCYFYFVNGPELGKYLNIGLILFTVVVSAYEIRKVVDSLTLARKAEYFKKLAATDALTGLSNREALYEWILKKEKLSPNEKETLAVIVCDVDQLKQINDSNGHQAGDLAICDTAQSLKTVFCLSSLCCRTGGDEFTCGLENMEPEETGHLIEAFLDAISKVNNSLPFELAVSIGCAHFSAELDKDLNNTIFRADQQMYHMKRNHRAERAQAAPDKNGVPEA